jgi:NitT/TauT family transport system permease protein
VTLTLGRRAAPVVATLVLWEGVGWMLAPSAFPPFSTVCLALVDLAASGRLAASLAASLSALVAGFTLAIVVGVAAGALMGSSRGIERVLEPYLHAGLAMPMLIMVPVLLAIGGPSRWTQIGTVFFYAVFVVASHMLAGMHNATRSTVDMARSLGASRWQMLTLVILPGARPMVLSGLRVSAALAVKGMVNGEMLTASVGIGALVRAHGGRFEVAHVLALVLVIVTITLSITAALQSLERRYLGGGSAV